MSNSKKVEGGKRLNEDDKIAILEAKMAEMKLEIKQGKIQYLK